MYKCLYCSYDTINKSNYNKHLVTLKHNENIKKPRKNHEKPRIMQEKTMKKPRINNEIPRINNEIPIKTTKTTDELSEDNFLCKYCDKPFKYKNSMYHHIKYTCKQNKDEDLKELVRLMNLQLQQKDDKIQILSFQMEKQSKQIDKLMDKLQVNITNNIVQNNTIQLLSYKDTDVTHLTEKDYIQSLKKVTYCVKHLIEKIHFNPVKPENMNIYISNMKDKYIMVYEDGNWNLKNKNKELTELYDKKEMMLDDWLNDNKNHVLRQKFEKYLNNKEHDETMNSIKDDIKLMMYNKKKQIEN